MRDLRGVQEYCFYSRKRGVGSVREIEGSAGLRYSETKSSIIGRVPFNDR